MPTGTTKVPIGLGFMVLLLFIFLRPITLMSTGITVFGFSIFEIFAAASSYLLLIVLLLNLRQLVFDRLNFLLLIFCIYCLSSFVWGSSIQMMARVILPLILIFAVRTFVREPTHVSMLLGVLCLGYLFPIIISTGSIALGKSIDRTDFYSGVIRYSGAFQGPHPFAYAMLNFMFVYCLFMRLVKSKSFYSVVSMRIFLIFSFFCLYMSGTRTAFVGCAVFWLIYSFSLEKKFRVAIIILCGILAITMSQNFQRIFWKTEQRDLNVATSGRIELWKHNIDVFQESPILKQLYGYGMGQTMGLTDSKTKIWSSHNDYLELLMGVGVIGLLLYLFLLCNLTWDISICSIDRKTKLLFGAILASIAVMNFGSNASIFRPENGQYFWFYMGLFYRVKEMHHIDALQPTIVSSELTSRIQKE
jgi:O-antigen ligase